MRTLTALVAMSATLGGCIIYEEKWTSTTDGCVDCPGPGPGGPGQPGPGAPKLTDDLSLTVREGTVGETVLTNLVAVRGGALDPRDVVAVSFDRDVLVSDIEVRDIDVVLLLQVVDGAQPGPVEVFVRMDDGREWVLIEPFTILEDTSTDTSADTGQTGTTGTSGDTGTDETGTTGPTDGTGTTDTGTTGGPDGTDTDGTTDTSATGTTDTGDTDTGLANGGDTGAP